MLYNIQHNGDHDTRSIDTLPWSLSDKYNRWINLAHTIPSAGSIMCQFVPHFFTTPKFGSGRAGSRVLVVCARIFQLRLR